MDFKLNLLTPSLYSKEGETNCVDTAVEKFANYLKHRADNEFSLPCKYNPVPGMAFIHSFEDFEERFLIHSEYAVIIASPYSQKALNQFNARLLVFLTAKPTWQNRFVFVCLGNVRIMSNLVIHDPIYFSLDDWETSDNESWITLFNMIKITWKPHIEEVPLTTTLNQISKPSHGALISVCESPSIEDTKKSANTSIQREGLVKMLETRSTQGSNVTVEHLIFNSENINAEKSGLFFDSETNTTPTLQEVDNISVEMSDNSDTESEQTFNCQSGYMENQAHTFIGDLDFEEYQGGSDGIFKDGKTLGFLKEDRDESDLNVSSSHEGNVSETLEEKVKHNQVFEAFPSMTTQNSSGANFNIGLEIGSGGTGRNKQKIEISNIKSDEQTRGENDDSSIFLDCSLTSNNSLTSNGETNLSERDVFCSKEDVEMEKNKKDEEIVHKGTRNDEDSEQPNASTEQDFITETIIRNQYQMENFETGGIESEEELYDFNPNTVNKETSSPNIPLLNNRFDSFMTSTDDGERDLDLKNEEGKLHKSPLDTNIDLEDEYGLGSKTMGKDYIISGKISSLADSEISMKDISQTPLTTEVKNISKSESFSSDSYGKSDNISLQRNNLDTENMGNINFSTKKDPNVANEEFKSEIGSLDVKTESKADNRSSELARDYEVENKKIGRFNIISDQTTSSNTDSQIGGSEGENISEPKAFIPESTVRFERDSYSNRDSDKSAADKREIIENKKFASKQNVNPRDGSFTVEKKNTFGSKSGDDADKSFHSTSDEAVKVSDEISVGEQESNVIRKQIGPNDKSEKDIEGNLEFRSSVARESRYLSSRFVDERLETTPNDGLGSFSISCKTDDERNSEKLQNSLDKDNAAFDANINMRVNGNEGKRPTELGTDGGMVTDMFTSKENKSKIDDRKIKDESISKRSTNKDLQMYIDDTEEKSVLHLEYENENEIFNKQHLAAETCLKTLNDLEENENEAKQYNIRNSDHERIKEHKETMNMIETDRGTFRKLQLLSNYLWQKIFSDRFSESAEVTVDESVYPNDFVPGYIRSPWYVALLFISGTLISRYWVDWTRRVFPTSMSPNMILGAISSSVIHEEAINRKWAIMSPEQGSFNYPGDSGPLDK